MTVQSSYKVYYVGGSLDTEGVTVGVYGGPKLGEVVHTDDQVSLEYVSENFL